MWKLKSLISLTFLIFGLQTHAGDPEDVLTKLMKRRESFRRIILSEKGIDFLKELSTSMTPQCGAAIRRTMATGGQLYSQTMRKAAVKAKDFPYYSSVNDLKFSHFTTSESFMQTFDDLPLKNSTENIFLYLRNLAKSYPQYPWWNKVFYLTEDPRTIADWAPYEVEFSIAAEALIYPYQTQRNENILKEIERNFPLIAKYCSLVPYITVQDRMGTYPYHPIFFIIAEETGIGLIDYNQRGAWFQAVSPDIFVAARAAGGGNGNNRSNYANPTKATTTFDLDYLETPVITVDKANCGAVDVTTEVALAVDGKEKIKIDLSFLQHQKTITKSFGSNGKCLIEWHCFKGGDHQQAYGGQQNIEGSYVDTTLPTFSLDCHFSKEELKNQEVPEEMKNPELTAEPAKPKKERKKIKLKIDDIF